MLDLWGKEGAYVLLSRRKNTMVVRFTRHNLPSQIFSITFNQTEEITELSPFIAPENLTVHLLDAVEYSGE
jgi:hypothetical protein